MEVYEITISKSQLESMPELERTLVLQFGHVCNELSFLNKLLLIVSDTGTEGIENSGMVAQSMIVSRIFIGKVFEAWRMMERDFFASKLSKEIEPKLPEEGKKTLKELKQYFGKNNLISTIRNEYSFHYISDHMAEILKAFDEKRKFKLILGPGYANTLHHFSEEIISMSMFDKTGCDKPQEAMDKIIGDLVVISGKMVQFLGYGLAQIFALRLGKSWEDFEYKKHEIEVKNQLVDYKLPYFFELDDKSPNNTLYTDARTSRELV
jgi:hypothetical protein